MQKFALALLTLLLLAFGEPVAAQSFSMPTTTIAPDFAMANLQRELQDRRSAKNKKTKPNHRPPSAKPAASFSFQYRVNANQRAKNINSFIAHTKKTDPEAASKLGQLFAARDIFLEIDKLLAPAGLKTNNVVDAYTAWLISMYDGANGLSRPAAAGQVAAVKRQVKKSLEASPIITNVTDASKQQLSDTLWIQVLLIDGAIEGSKKDPDLLKKMSAIVRQSARTWGVDFNKIDLTDAGFVAKK